MTEQLDVGELVEFTLHALADGDLDLHLDRIAAVVHARQRAVFEIADAAAMARIKVNDRVRVLPDGNRSSKWDYRKGTVIGRKGKRVQLQLDPEGGYRGSGTLLIPPSMLEVI